MFTQKSAPFPCSFLILAGALTVKTCIFLVIHRSLGGLTVSSAMLTRRTTPTTNLTAFERLNVAGVIAGLYTTRVSLQCPHYLSSRASTSSSILSESPCNVAAMGRLRIDSNGWEGRTAAIMSVPSFFHVAQHVGVGVLRKQAASLWLARPSEERRRDEGRNRRSRSVGR